MKELAISILALLMLSATSVQADLIGEWHFDEGTGNTASDSSGSGIDGDIFNATWITDGVCGNALNFDGAGPKPEFDYVSFDPLSGSGGHESHRLVDLINSNDPRNYTISTWIRPASLPFNTIKEIMTFDAIKFAQADQRFVFNQAYEGSFNRGYQVITGNILTVGPWMHLVGVHNEDVGVKVYFNGLLAGSDFTKVAADGTARITHGTQVGTSYHHNLAVFAGTRIYTGDIDEVRMYNHALTAAQVMALFEAGCGGPPEITCEGFFPPFDQPLLLKKKSKRAIPVKMILLDGTTEITDLDLSAPPVVEVRVGDDTGSGIPGFDGDLLPPGLSDDGNEFRFDTDDMQWIINLGTKQYKGSLTYVVTAKSGDPSSYVIDPSCSQEFTRP